jgi:FlaA1/EpsC-like NDP-sugar epimerase
MTRIRNRHFMLLDLLAVGITPTLALTLRVLAPWKTDLFYFGLITYTLLSILIKLPVFYFFNLYRRYWRYASINEMLSIIQAVMVASILCAGIFFGLHIFGFFTEQGLPRTVPIIDALLTLVVISGTRFSIRAYLDHHSRPSQQLPLRRVLIVGAGDAGEVVAREIFSSGKIHLDLVGYVDDDQQKIGTFIHGRPVLGPLANIPNAISKYEIQEVIVAMPTVSGKVVRKVLKSCEEENVPVKMVPGMYELLSGRVNFEGLRNIEIGDLLRRSPVQIDTHEVRSLISGKRILITGAGGSIGSELCEQIIGFQPAQMILLGHGENSLFSIFQRLTADRNNVLDKTELKLVVADVRNKIRMDTIITEYTPEIIFHAAAHKHVPMMEENIEEAITNNILGTLNMVELSKKIDVEAFVYISTDKAVNPVNVMGMTKRVAELIVREAAIDTSRPYVSVRFGNVLGSRGSVVPLFQQQIAMGGPVTVTDPEMERYFMTIPEAVQLVLQASSLGTHGELYVLDMGDPVNITDLARDMIELSGYQVGRDIEIEYTGLRPGERLFEELFTNDENPVKTKHDKIYVTLNQSSFILGDDLEKPVTALIELALIGDSKDLRAKLAHLSSL